MTSLCLLAQKYYVDKCPAIYHHYTPKYHKLLKDKKVTVFLEIGIGNHELMAPIVGDHYIHGASLRMWRDYFPQAEIIGCDINSSDRLASPTDSDMTGAHFKIS